MPGGIDRLRELARWLPAGPLRPFGRPVALFFHGVEERIEDPRIQLNQHRADEFRAITKTLSEQFQVMPLDALDDALEHPERHERTVFLMSDDGYANTLTVAADILEEQRLPWTLFVSSHHIDTGEFNPMTLARLFLLYAPSGRYRIADFADAIDLQGDDERLANSVDFLRRLKAMNATRANRVVAAMMAALPDELRNSLLARFKSEAFLSWAQVIALSKRGVEIGAHAHVHWPMHLAQTPEYVREQAYLS